LVRWRRCEGTESPTNRNALWGAIRGRLLGACQGSRRSTMFPLSIADEFTRVIRARTDWPTLKDALDLAARRMGFHYFAAIHHIDFAANPHAGLRLHNYPSDFVRRFDIEQRGPSDPIHRASHVTASGFRWRDVPDMIALTRRDTLILEEARACGIGEGYTKPAHIPGEARGSISFAVETGAEFPEDMIPCALFIGDLAFEAARRAARRFRTGPRLHFTDRELECIVLVGRGATDRQIAQALGVRPSTVIEHLRNARASCDLTARGVLPLRAMLEGFLCISDFFPGASPFLGMG
jgi:LuxR family transcriptional regulator, quorum-sensing system regulator CciR